MSTDYKPSGYTAVAPYLVVDDAKRTIQFLIAVFDAQPLRMVPAPSGRLMHSEVRIDDTVVMLADGPESWPPNPSHVHIYVRDVDVTYRRALAQGAQSVQEPVKKEDSDKRGGFKDPSGVTWWVATQVS